MDAAENEVIKSGIWVVAGLGDAFLPSETRFDYFAGLRDIFRHLYSSYHFTFGVMSTIAVLRVWER